MRVTPSTSPVEAGLGDRVSLVYDEMDGTPVSVCLLGTHERVLVDSGMPTTPKLVRAALAREGQSIGSISAIVHTHAHGDHIAGDSEILSEHPVPVLIHSAEADILAEPAKLGSYIAGLDDEVPLSPMTPDWVKPVAPTALVGSGDRIVVEEVTWRIVDAPGHSPGGICLFDDDTRVLIAGDAVQGTGTAATGVAFYFEAETYLETLERISSLSPGTIIAGHPFLKGHECVLRDAAVETLLTESKRAFRRYDEILLESLRAADGPVTYESLSHSLASLESVDWSPAALYTTRAHLRRLRALGDVGKVFVQGQAQWLLIG